MHSPSDWAAILFVCKHLNQLKHFSVSAHVFENLDCVLEITKLLQHRCIETLEFIACRISHVQEVLKYLLRPLTTECRMNHEHSKLSYLNLSRNKITDDDVSILTEFLENAHGVCLKNLDLSGNEITSVGISKCCYVLSQEVCNQLEVLNLDYNQNKGDDGMRILCSALGENQYGLRELHLKLCSVTSTGASWFGQAFRGKNCEITHLDISSNCPCDKGVRMFCNGFRKGNCVLDVLDLSYCKLTHACMHDLSEVLKNQRVGLTTCHFAPMI